MMMDKILCLVDKSDMPIITTVWFIILLINRYTDLLLSLPMQFLLIPE